MTRTITFIFLLLAFGQIMAQKPLQLAPPQTASNWRFGGQGQTVAFDFRMAGAVIRYTIDGSEPTEQSPVYTKPIKTENLKFILARSFMPGYEPSDISFVNLVQPGNVRIDSMAIVPAPKKYVANGWKALSDGVLGDDNFHENWLGFDEKEVEIKLFFAKKKRIKKFAIGYLRHQGAWIFNPVKVEVYNESGRLLATVFTHEPDKQLPSGHCFSSSLLPPGKHKALTIKVKGLPAIPDWHPGKGGAGWIFLDEIMVHK